MANEQIGITGATMKITQSGIVGMQMAMLAAKAKKNKTINIPNNTKTFRAFCESFVPDENASVVRIGKTEKRMKISFNVRSELAIGLRPSRQPSAMA